MIPFSKPSITWREKLAVLKVLNTPMLSTGPKVCEFERRIAKLVQVKEGIATNSGTSALHMLLEYEKIGVEDEVITTPFTFVATANAIEHCGAKPIFADIDEKTYMLDTKKARQAITNNTKAIIPVHLFGAAMCIDELLDTKITVIEDAAEALGVTMKHRPKRNAFYIDKYAGTVGKAGIFGFFPNKQITTGEGGMIVTNDSLAKNYYDVVRRHGLASNNKAYFAGYNYKLTDIQSAIGIEQVKRFNVLKKQRIKLAKKYNEYLNQISYVTIYHSNSLLCMGNIPFVYHILLHENFTKDKRDRIIKYMYDKNIICRVYFDCVHLQPYYKSKYRYKKGDFPIAESISDRSIALPFYPNMKTRYIKEVVKYFKEALLYVN